MGGRLRALSSGPSDAVSVRQVMELVFSSLDGEAEISISQTHPADTVGDLVRAITGSPPPPLVDVDGRTVPSETSTGASGLLTGMVIRPQPVSELSPTGACATVVQLTGPGAGHRRQLSPGRYRLGPSRKAQALALTDAPVTDSYAEVTVDIAGRVSVITANGTLDGALCERSTPWHEQTLTIGQRRFRLDRDTPDRSQSTSSISGSVPFLRPPRSSRPPTEPPLVVPVARDQGPQLTLPWIAALVPLPVAAVMAWLIGPRALLFAALAPMIFGINLIAERRRDARRQSGASAATGYDLKVFNADLTERHRIDLIDARSNHPDIAEIVRRAENLSVRLWERRLHHEDALSVSLGLADITWNPPLAQSEQRSIDARPLIDRCGPLVSIPVVADFMQHRGVGIIGPMTNTRAIARSLLLQLCVLHGPADVDVVILTSGTHASRWEWAKWLPQSRVNGSFAMLDNDDDIARWVDSRQLLDERPGHSQRGQQHFTIVVVDDETLWKGRSAVLRPVLAEAASPVRFIMLSEYPEGLPAACTTLVAPHSDGTATVRYPTERRAVESVGISQLDMLTALSAARRLARFEDQELPATRFESTAETVSLVGALGMDEVSAAAIRRRWQASNRSLRSRAPIGRTGSGVLDLDLLDDGPHGLVIDSTGAGKGEFLRSMVVSFAASIEPERLNLVLIDTNDGTVFDVCEQLPHTVSIITKLDQRSGARLIRQFRSEVRRRQQSLATAGVTTFAEYHRLANAAPMPRLVTVMDEFADVAEALPDFFAALLDTVERGESVGFHLVLATQRPTGVLENNVKSTTSFRVVLRVRPDDQVAERERGREFVAEFAGRDDRSTTGGPSRSYARLGDGDLVSFQSVVSAGNAPLSDRQLTAVPWVFGRDQSSLELRMTRSLERSLPDRRRRASRTDAEDLVEAIYEAAARAGQSTQIAPVVAALPSVVTMAVLNELTLATATGTTATGTTATGTAAAAPFALADYPDAQVLAPYRWSPGADSNLIAVGRTGSGTSTLLTSLAMAADTRSSTRPAGSAATGLYVLDADLQHLADLAHLDICLGVATLADWSRVEDMIIELDQMLTEGRAENTLWLVDKLDELLRRCADSDNHDQLVAAIEHIVRDGAAAGLNTVATTAGAEGLETLMTATFPKRIVMDLGFSGDYAMFGLDPNDLPTFVAGRGILVPDNIEMQVVVPLSDQSDERRLVDSGVPVEQRSGAGSGPGSGAGL